jgi:hypothetical protein
MSWGDKAEALHPPELREKAGKIARNLITHYFKEEVK